MKNRVVLLLFCGMKSPIFDLSINNNLKAMKILVLNQTIFNLYWRGILQTRSPFISVIYDHVWQNINQGAKQADFTLTSQFGSYTIEDLLNGNIQ
jgi:hypothetical protein